MARATVNNLTSGGDGTNQNSYTTASISPAVGLIVLVGIYSHDDDGSPQIPTLSGNGLTWTQVNTTSSGNVRVTVFRALATSPSSGIITIDFGGDIQNDCQWTVEEFDNLKTSGTNGADAIVQSAVNASASAEGLSITLSAFNSAINATYGFIAANNPSSSISAGSGFSQISQVVSPHKSQSQWRDDNDTTVDWTWTTNAITAGVGVELQAVTGGMLLASEI